MFSFVRLVSPSAREIEESPNTSAAEGSGGGPQGLSRPQRRQQGMEEEGRNAVAHWYICTLILFKKSISSAMSKIVHGALFFLLLFGEKNISNIC